MLATGFRSVGGSGALAMLLVCVCAPAVGEESAGVTIRISGLGSGRGVSPVAAGVEAAGSGLRE